MLSTEVAHFATLSGKKQHCQPCDTYIIPHELSHRIIILLELSFYVYQNVPDFQMYQINWNNFPSPLHKLYNDTCTPIY